MASKRRRIKTTTRFFALLTFVCVAIVAVIYLAQERKLSAIYEEQKALEDELNALENEEQRMEYMIEYAHSEEYMIQYAREKLGYVKPDDYILDIE